MDGDRHLPRPHCEHLLHPQFVLATPVRPPRDLQGRHPHVLSHPLALHLLHSQGRQQLERPLPLQQLGPPLKLQNLSPLHPPPYLDPLHLLLAFLRPPLVQLWRLEVGSHRVIKAQEPLKEAASEDIVAQQLERKGLIEAADLASHLRPQ